MMHQLKLAVFVSGRGSNLEAIVHATQAGTLSASVVLVLSSNPEAGALEFAASNGIPGFAIPRRSEGAEQRTRFILEQLRDHDTDFIALAGFMHLLEPEVVRAHANRILNIHPALLPAFGGKGMYGSHVHDAVLKSGAKVSGVTVHLVDEAYDRGPIVSQRVVPVLPEDTRDSLAARVLKAEHSLYPETLQLFAESRVSVENHNVKITGVPPSYILE